MGKNALIDSSGVLRSWGYCDFSAQTTGGFMQIAVPEDFSHMPGQWKTLDAGATWMPHALPARPDVSAFWSGLVTLAGNEPALNNLLSVFYPTFKYDLFSQNWPSVQAWLIDANAKVRITAAQYAEIKAAVTTYSIPVTLP